MFTLLKSLHSRQVYLSEPASFIAALVIAELFYKFKSFLLETAAFLLTWFILGAIVHTVTNWMWPKAEAVVMGRSEVTAPSAVEPNRPGLRCLRLRR